MTKSFTAKITALATALACLVCMSACQKEMPKRLDGMYSSAADTSSSAANTDSQSDTSGSEESIESCPAPKFHSGNYVMASTSNQEQYIYSGSSVVSFIKLSQTYTYNIKLTVKDDNSMTAVYTFSRIQTSYEGSESETMDTNNTSDNSDENKPYFDLIGQSFTVNVSKDYKLSISGIDKINTKYPDTSDIISDENMLEIASDLFYNIDSELKVGSTWNMTQSGITNTYKVGKVSSERLVIDIIGGELTVPDTFTSGSFTYHYTACNSLSGSLVMNLSDRMIQEQSSYQDNKGTLDYSGTTYDFTESASSVCNISKI
jgi:hypothetical protein